ncbi:hypothetical protein CFOL_v3_22492 [Cephalotus follicularis]|uniref:Uncharacterized protein n=1 Tax=Cephalotus follicularis TaxID=3775 RepID=A0A1Q3CFN6_CEPFO|nr:hypothetical protein CFOL_v3_22492 [Cephalotus follicularis]
MTATILSSCNAYIIQGSRKQNPSQSRLYLGVGHRMLHSIHSFQQKKSCYRYVVFAATKGSANPRKSEETIPSWAKPDSDEPPPWASNEGKGSTSQQSIEIPFGVYLAASAVTAIAAIGSMFEYVNKKPVFGVLNSDSIFYAPLLGFFVFTGIPTAAFLWFKSVQVANKEADEQDKRDGYL